MSHFDVKEILLCYLAPLEFHDLEYAASTVHTHIKKKPNNNKITMILCDLLQRDYHKTTAVIDLPCHDHLGLLILADPVEKKLIFRPYQEKNYTKTTHFSLLEKLHSYTDSDDIKLYGYIKI